MNRTIYYTVNVGFYEDDYELGPTGFKTINLYFIDANSKESPIKLRAEISAKLNTISVDEIKTWLDDNGYDNINFTLKAL